MITKSDRFSLEWWAVSKGLIYKLFAFVLTASFIAGISLYLWKYGSPFKSAGMTVSAPSGARFTSFEGDVRVIRSATRETITANAQTQLYPGDTVQTQADGRARIGMADGSTVVVSPNSTIIIRDNASTENGQRTNVRVQVEAGKLNVRTEQQPEGTTNVVETRQTQNKLAGETSATFGVNPDLNEEIRVGSGQMETTTSSGEKTTVRGGEFVAVTPGGALARREHLLDVPVPVAPRDLDKIPAGANGAASLTLKWQRPAQGTPSHYRVEVATSPFFVAGGRVIERDQLATNEFEAADLRPGVYFWRVSATAASGQVSDWSEPQKFIIAPSGTGQRVAVSEVVTDYIGGQIYLVKGRAQPGTTVRIGDREALAGGDQTFQLQITARAGERNIVLEAQDPQGNRSQYRIDLARAGGDTRSAR